MKLPTLAWMSEVQNRWPLDRETVHRRALIWMLELVDVEWILIVNPRLLAEMVPGAR
jgi:hypothetical protein